MLKLTLKLTSVVFLTILTACNPSDRNLKSKSNDIDKNSNSAKSNSVKFEPFNNIDEVRQKLSSIGIGELGRWRDDEMGGYMSITPYFEFGKSSPSNNLAIYLESDNSSSIKTIKIVLNINNKDKKEGITKLSEVISKTYEVLGLEIDSKMLNELKQGKELSSESENYITKTIQVKSNVETWKFILETK